MMKNRFLFVVMLFTALTLGFASCDNEKGNEPEISITGTENGHAYVDLGLPSGLKWAACNVGAESPEEYGYYFAWGETTPKITYDWSTYKWCNGSYGTMTKYCIDSRCGIVDNKTVLDLEDDAAAVNMGGSWRMPTEGEQYELIKKCRWIWTTLNGVKGFNVKGPNGNSIFLPAAGHCVHRDLDYAGVDGYYWSSSLSFSTDANSYAYNLLFFDYWSSLEYFPLPYGQSVRGVTK